MDDQAALIGLMSGTSLDGVDGVLARVAADGQWQGVLAHAYEPFGDQLRAELLALNQSGPDELHRAALAGQAVARAYARVVQRLRATQPHASVTAIGAHGQTVRHRPELGYTLQLLAPALLAELAGVAVVADFRSRDVAAGGQGAPLVPVFHEAVFARPDGGVAVLNIGGIANVSLLAAAKPPLGFDCGPGNVLMDAWCQRHTGRPYDDDGAWGATGQVQDDWLAHALSEPFFALPPPKSTGRDLFHGAWLEAWLDRCGASARAPARAADVQATLCELTAVSCAVAITGHQHPGDTVKEVVVCGGGAFNGLLMRRLQEALHGQAAERKAAAAPTVVPSDARGLPPGQVEAAAFAWLAWATVNRRAGNVPAVTGASGPRVLGAIYPA
ncbi:MAG: anhydro-N-acetylmuramic acid kinase [Rubrivivax sp.]|nr:MAG: anhydro-N-acetylmuramic acid kinase [Rubrivivax sp.]